MTQVIIREENSFDCEAIRRLHLLAFAEPGPGRLVDELRSSGEAVISVVAEINGEIAGHALFSELDAPMRSLALAPVGVLPDFKHQGFGYSVIGYGIELAKQQKWEAIFVLGAPLFYERFGFDVADAEGYLSPYAGADFMALLLNKSAPSSGELLFPSPFASDIQDYARRQRKA